MVLYKGSYNLSAKGELVSGEIIVTKENITLTENSVEKLKFDINNISEISIQNNIASAELILTPKGKDSILICGFTMEYIKSLGELCKATNYYLATGIYNEIEEIKDKKIGSADFTMKDIREKKIFRNLFSLAGKYKKPFLFAGILLTLSNCFYVLVPYLNRILIDKYLSPKIGTVADIIIICGAIFLTRAVGEVIFIISSRIIAVNGQKMTADIRMKAYANVQKLSMSSLSEKTSGDLMKRITNDVMKVRNFFETQGKRIFEQGIIFIIVTIILFVTSPKLALIVFLPFPLVFFITMKLKYLINRRYHKQWKIETKANIILHDIISGIKVVKSCGKEKQEIKKYSTVSKELADTSIKNERLWSIIFPILGFVIGIGEYLVLYFGGFDVLGGALTKGELVQFIMYTGFIYGPIQWLVFLPRWIGEMMVSLTKVLEIMNEKPAIINSVNSLKPNINGDINLKNVVFGYKSYEPILKEITAEIKSGEMIGLVGASGSGKSTTINLILRLYDVDSGSLTLDNTDIRDIDTVHLHKNTGVVFQDTFLFVGSVYDNIKYTCPTATVQQVISAAKISSAHEFIIKLPDGYNTIVGEHGYSLSGGERQRIAIARAIITNPSLLILDEATSSLDAQTEETVQNAMQKVIKGRTTIAIAHKLSTLKNANRLFVMDSGKIVEKGTHKELLQKKGRYYNLVMAQLQMSKKD
ncbi:MAG: ABC transporter ATP-binding protein [Clostridia bacterium]